ncbi:MAG: glycosyltransferase family 4 protein [Gammaproteobacteria bacterium]|nr:glycosyltransferase family 4 protein [Gammaproteobacteria bacterium]
MNFWWLFISLVGTSWLLTGLLRRYALTRSLLDVPNNRSSHSVPTPRGGGLSIVLTFLVGLLLFWFLELLDTAVFIGLSGAGVAVAAIGFIDDHGHVAARWRLLGHFSAAGWLVFWLGGMPPLELYGFGLDLSWPGDVLLVIALVWLLNLYNFMDGIDGIAGVEAASSAFIAALLFLFVLDGEMMFRLNLLMVAAVTGFLAWNFPPAKIFMGDAGSGFVGLMLGALALYSAHLVPVMLWAWLILLGVFIVDATFTLLRRLLRGDKVYQAHCSHAYQSAARKYGGHRAVTLSVLAINLFWLAPWATAVVLGMVDGILGSVAAYLPLFFLAWYFRAGEIEAAS